MVYTGEQKKQYQLAWLNKRRQDWIDNQGGVCVRCGSADRLEIDHIDPKFKSMQPAGIWSRAEHIREAELANCQVLCYTCHSAKSVLYRKPEHGTNSRYTSRKWACRCSLCKNAHAVYNRSNRKSSRVATGVAGGL